MRSLRPETRIRPCAASRCRLSRAATTVGCTALGVARPIEQHRVAIREEAIAFSRRARVRACNTIHSAERIDEREERRAREMEVREEPIDHAKPVARLDEQARLARAWSYESVAFRIACGLERAN